MTSEAVSTLVVNNNRRGTTIEVVPSGDGYLRIFFRDPSGVGNHSPKMTPEEVRILAAMLDNAATAEDGK